MPRRTSKGPRLWLQKGRPRADGYAEQSVWCILDDGGFKRRTGCGEADRAGAEDQLRQYLAEKVRTKPRPRNSSADQVAIADVISLYMTTKAPAAGRPKESLARLSRLLEWWGARTLDEINGALCRRYAAERGSDAAARRELEDLRAAIRFHRQEGFCREIVEVVLPEKSLPRERWLSRAEVARLLKQAWSGRAKQGATVTKLRPWKHVARFILVALYTGTRAGAVCSACFEPREGFGWIDLDRGVFYRRPVGERETKKRRPPVRLPDPLLAHLRRWHRLGQTFAVEFRGEPVLDVDRAFRKVAVEAKLDDVTPHTLRHTAATWLMQDGVDLWEAGGYLGMTQETLEQHYGHHHPDHLSGAVESMGRRGKARGKIAERMPVNMSEQDATNVVKIGRKPSRGR